MPESASAIRPRPRPGEQGEDGPLQKEGGSAQGRRTVLIVSFRFPPHGGGGVHRVAAFSRHLPHVDAVRTICAADLLLLLNIEESNILGKTFEYLASGRPILALVPPGPTADLVREARAGSILAADSEDEIASSLLEGFQAWERGESPSTTDPAVVERFTRRRTTELLASVFEDVMKADRPARRGSPRP